MKPAEQKMKPAEQKMNRKFVKIREQKGRMFSERNFSGGMGEIPPSY